MLDTPVNFYYLIDSFQMDPQIYLGLTKNDTYYIFWEFIFLQFEQKRGHVASGIECYMKQNGVSKQEAHDEF